MNSQENKLFDVAIIGGGPAGMMAAIRASELGASVVLVEKNNQFGRKLLLTGNGRCNLTNAEFDLRKLVSYYGPKGKFLFHAFSVFGPQSTIDFFKSLGLMTKTEKDGRVFPQSNKAERVLFALSNRLIKNGVRTRYNSKIMKIYRENNRINKLVMSDGREIFAKNYIFCTGGKSFPGTGSDGAAFEFIQELGHKIEKLSPALVPIRIKEKWAKDLEGVTLQNVGIKVTQNNNKIAHIQGDCLLTHFGLSGPMILNLSKDISGLPQSSPVTISIDLHPALKAEDSDQHLQNLIKKFPNKLIKNFLGALFAPKLVPVLIKLIGIDPERQSHSITKEERKKIAWFLNNLEMTVDSLLGFDVAMVTKGGVSLKEIDDKTMRSKIVDNLFFAGEMVDLDGPTGGFNLQIAWSTGFLAGEKAARFALSS